jgi:hypothetical protein
MMWPASLAIVHFFWFQLYLSDHALVDDGLVGWLAAMGDWCRNEARC